MKTVGIIGGSGFIGSYNTQKFLNEGYKLKVSTTDISKKEKYEHLLKFQHAENLEIVQMNVENKLDLINFLQGCSIVIHGGTPFQLDVKDPKNPILVGSKLIKSSYSSYATPWLKGKVILSNATKY